MNSLSNEYYYPDHLGADYFTDFTEDHHYYDQDGGEVSRDEYYFLKEFDCVGADDSPPEYTEEEFV